MSKETDSSISFGLGLLAGVVAGIIAGVVYAPKSGEETRDDLIHKAKVIKSNFPKKIECAKNKSIRSIECTKLSIERLFENIHDSLKAQKMASAKIKESETWKNKY